LANEANKSTNPALEEGRGPTDLWKWMDSTAALDNLAKLHRQKGGPNVEKFM
jgi:hypothetical protein